MKQVFAGSALEAVLAAARRPPSNEDSLADGASLGGLRRSFVTSLAQGAVKKSDYDDFAYVSVRVVDPPPDSRSRTSVSVPPLTLRMSRPQFMPCLKCRCSFGPSQCARVLSARTSPGGVDTVLLSSVKTAFAAPIWTATSLPLCVITIVSGAAAN